MVSTLFHQMSNANSVNFVITAVDVHCIFSHVKQNETVFLSCKGLTYSYYACAEDDECWPIVIGVIVGETGRDQERLRDE